MTKRSLVEQSAIKEARRSLGRTTVMAIAVSQYSYLETLPGTIKDLELIKDLFVKNDESLYKENMFVQLKNPTLEQTRQAILKYVYDRSGHGEVLLFYFSGHGCIIGDNSFGFCLADTRAHPESGAILPLSALSFREVVQTLSSFDVHPVFVIDACFSGATARSVVPTIGAIMDHELYIQLAGAYGLLCSSNADMGSIDTDRGGVFTRTLCGIVSNGLSDRQQRHWPFVTIRNLAQPLQEHLAQQSFPLSRCYIGSDLPEIPIANNPSFKPNSVYFSPQMRKVVEHLWNNGSPKEATGTELGKIAGPGAYGNHRKLSLRPWDLLEKGQGRLSRRLTRRGKLFAQEKLRIPRKIIKDPGTLDWVAADDTESVLVTDITYEQL